MANKIILKKSSVASKIPLTSDLDLGELALNTYDGKLFTKKNVSSVESIVEIGEVKESRSNTFTANQVISVTDNTNAALRITQLGTGEAIRVEDSTNPDATSFVVNSDGNVTIGVASATSGLAIERDGATQLNIARNSDNVTPPYLVSIKRRGTSASKVIVNNGDQALSIQAYAYDGSADKNLASIEAYVDNVPGTNDMPGRLVFSTTADGASSPTERMRISSDGDVLVTSGSLSIGNTDTTITRSAAGVIAVEGVTVPLNSTTNTHTAQQYEIGNASDTTLTRVSAGVAAIEGKNIALNGTSEVLTTGSIELGNASDTTITRSAAGVIAVEGGIVPKENRTNTFTANQIIEVTDNTNAALRITQLGTAYAIRVDDSANPDSTPFVVTATGTIGVGTENPTSSVDIVSSSSDGNSPTLTIRNTSGVTPGFYGPTIKLSNGVSGKHGYIINQEQSSGSSFQIANPDSPFDRYFVIDQSGNVGIGISSPTAKLSVLTGSGTGVSVPSWGANHAIFGPNVGNSAGACLGLTYNSTSNKSEILSLAPGIAWTELNIYSSGFAVLANNGSESMRITAAGDVGIGTNSPGYKLEVNGSFAAITKSFVIDHPTKPDMKLRYGSLESPYHGVRLTGESIIATDKVVVDLPDYIHGLCKQEGAQVQITNIKHDKVIWVDEIDIENNRFIVCVNRKKSDKKEYRFYWSFTAIRKDIEDMIVEF